ncbi:MucR family transcriptional regulator [Litorimonas sp.]|uniref:MucR family transcriptional regulator n=1 Tax=Litorimonas sp. TaxID=1892381 RepID=UPI003A87B36C
MSSAPKPPKPEKPSGDDLSPEFLLTQTTKIAAAYLSNNSVEAEAIPDLLGSIYEGLVGAARAGEDGQEAKALVPAVPIEESLKDDVIICLEDGKPYQSLKRHLRVKYGMNPEEYREKWGLPADYPMVAPAYAKRRSELAKRTGLGKSRP